MLVGTLRNISPDEEVFVSNDAPQILEGTCHGSGAWELHRYFEKYIFWFALSPASVYYYLAHVVSSITLLLMYIEILSYTRTNGPVLACQLHRPCQACTFWCIFTVCLNFHVIACKTGEDILYSWAMCILGKCIGYYETNRMHSYPL